MSDLYAVVGNPVSHSLSPKIHSLFAQQVNHRIHYKAIHSELDEFETNLQNFFAEGGMGLNITVPFKLRALEFADSVGPDAERAGAANTLIRKDDGSIHAENTDGVGLIKDLLQNHKLSLKDSRVLVLGAGGAVRGILLPLFKQEPKLVTLVNRTFSKAKELQESFKEQGNVECKEYRELSSEPYDLIINGTSASLEGELPPLVNTVFHDQTFCYDMMYGKTDTAFVAWCKQQGCENVADGLGMLVEQAAESFWWWRQLRPNTAPVLAKIRDELTQT